jgi:hypothetical protein
MPLNELREQQRPILPIHNLEIEFQSDRSLHWFIRFVLAAPKSILVYLAETRHRTAAFCANFAGIFDFFNTIGQLQNLDAYCRPALRKPSRNFAIGPGV